MKCYNRFIKPSEDIDAVVSKRNSLIVKVKKPTSSELKNWLHDNKNKIKMILGEELDEDKGLSMTIDEGYESDLYSQGITFCLYFGNLRQSLGLFTIIDLIVSKANFSIANKVAYFNYLP